MIVVAFKRVVVAGKLKGNLDDEISPVFGRCGGFCVFDLADGNVSESKIISNPAIDLPGSAGVVAADSVVKLGADAVVAGDFGVASTEIFYKSGVKQYIVKDTTIKDALEKMISGETACVDSKNYIESNKPLFGRRSITLQNRNNLKNNNSYICRNCGCTMPRKEGLMQIHCPNCGNMMEL